MTTQSEREDERRAAVAYSMNHGQSPEAEAARTLQRFMCCQAGQDLVEHGLLRPFGYTLDPTRPVQALRVLRDELQHWEAILAGEAHELHHDFGRAEEVANVMARICESMRRALEATKDV